MSRAADLANLIASGNTTIHGEAGVTSNDSTGKTTNLQQGLCKAWVTMDSDASTVVAFDSFNTSAVTDDGTGKYGANINSVMNNAHYYEIGCGCNNVDDGNDYNRYVGVSHGFGSIDAERTTSVAKIGAYNAAFVDVQTVGVSIHGDLA